MRRGTIIVEIVVGCTLLAVLLAVAVQLLSLAARQRQDTERRAIATQQAANFAEHVAALPFEQITAERLEAIVLPVALDRALPHCTARFAVDEVSGELPAKRVRVAIARDVRGGDETLAEVTTWAYPPGAGATP